MNPALKLTGATLAFGDGDQVVKALDHVGLTLDPGHFLGVVGPSGAGKSTLLAVAGALAKIDSGTVEIHGTDLGDLWRSQGKLAAFRLSRIGFVFQTNNLIPALSAADQLRLVAKMAGGDKGFDPMPLLDAVGMAHRADHRPGQLSGGERQRIGIARALVTNPSLLLVDEPTAALDRNRSQQIVELLATQSRERGVATLMVTHDHDVLHHCDEVVEMVDGKIRPFEA